MDQLEASIAKLANEADYDAMRKDYTECVDALGRAICVLNKVWL